MTHVVQQPVFRDYAGNTGPSELCRKGSAIDPALYEKLDVKRGLRDINGKGVLAGLTEISEIQSSMVDESGSTIPCEGKLFYHGINIKDLVSGFIREKRFGFEEAVYLLLFGQLHAADCP